MTHRISRFIFSLPSTHSKFEDHEDEESWQDRNRAIVSSVLRWLIIMCLLGIFFQLGNKAGLLPLNGGAAMDMRIVWNVQSVPQAARDQRLVPWWKLATVTLKVDVDIVAGKGKYVEVVADTTWANRPFILREARVASDVDRSSVMRRRRFAAADRF